VERQLWYFGFVSLDVNLLNGKLLVLRDRIRNRNRDS
jgi:hypothetical protein